MSTPVDTIIAEIQTLYQSDSIPWIIGYSGGKDSTASLQLVWKAVAQLPASKRTKLIYVISTDTLVENPVIASWVSNSLECMRHAADAQNMPIVPNRLVPTLENRFWVSLIGKGYPAPRNRFRWCTDRLKISASTKFIQELSESNGEAILVLGQRRGESNARDKVMDTYSGSTRDRLSRNKDPRLSRVWVYLPVETWTSDDVWEYLITDDNPWGVSNQELFHIYRGATQDAECPIVVDTSTPSCGDSRFGCYVCTMVSQDKSMQAMIQNDDQKAWMQPILDFRNKQLTTVDRDVRDFRRMSGQLKVLNGSLIHGPYLQSKRVELLRELLATQKMVKQAGDKVGYHNVELISLEELEEIRRIWVEEKGEIEDLLPGIYESIYQQPYPGKEIESVPLDTSDFELLKTVTEELDPEAAETLYRLTRSLLAEQFQAQQTLKRSQHLDRLESILQNNAFRTEEEALAFAMSTQQQESNEQQIDEASDDDSSDASTILA
ncbi:DNA phosphorothioation system sulfurtransferase DndC [Chromobacterium subtsugae]|uniref:DNA phosphorothioation system sulfurtransferase DndC n=1 Tax=Chromobacterium subtsugae TaxID=251747 RepID=A0ABS7F8B6_9NEIS|nr:MULTISPECIES: DNA phosphorothioation system sulfurtransferase DndC [Chromobacterium]KUM03588.1 sulfurtransferase DndC [Chromobacterium subtsugae]KZE86727.1 sulfurtransferase DndC [Chromobacterium sp. F49]MBW7565180.1 DNA phosphorothioation system sulfurtransferase DndC [Chromobacterium subtsugae]MBW8286292.1 DNA phosphorothioation system sulfurtransferase DndC [Chromobacterium subtsugae]WSE91660.1 DNA phosphorothioation system sulfurtransferase DndC [Chromobacterium subtsugae]